MLRVIREPKKNRSRRSAMTPVREDFEVSVRESGVDVTFKPTKSE
jgi:hypothetical protein